MAAEAEGRASVGGGGGAGGGGKDSPLRCSLCGKAFTEVANRKRHERNVHGVTPAYKNTGIKCNKCTLTFPFLRHYREHLQAHDVFVGEVSLKFNCEEEFMEWKSKLEKEIGVNYILHRGAKRTAYGSSRQVYHCRRSGTERVSCLSEHTKRAAKSQGTCKIGQFCTSSIEVERSDGMVWVTYFVDHYDHDINVASLAHMTLPKGDKDKIAGMITHGVSYNEILDHVRETSGKDRASLLTRKDIENIARAYGLTHTQHRHPQAAVVEEMQEKIKDEILNNLVPKCEKVKDLQVLNCVEELVSEAIALLDGSRSARKEPSYKNGVKQDNKLYSTTKKKRRQTHEGAGFEKPRTKERLDTAAAGVTQGGGGALVPICSEGDVGYEHAYSSCQ